MASVLLMEDDDGLRGLLRAYLELDGHSVVEAADGRSGIAQYRSEPTDVVITDLVMPDKEGLETIQELRAFNPDVPIIAISGGGIMGADAPLKVARMLGAQRVFLKPVDRHEFLDAVRELAAGG